MTVAVLITGSLFKPPEQRTSARGKSYVSTTLKVTAADNATSEFWSALAFGDTAGAELMRLAVGERVAIQGALKIELYTANDGTKKISRTVFADNVLALRAAPRERKAAENSAPSEKKTSKNNEDRSTAAENSAAGGPAFFDDDVPFEAAR